MSDSQIGPGYWQASDGLWYAPEMHPDFQASSPPPPNPGFQPPPGPGSQPAPGVESSGKKPFLRRKWVWIVGVVGVVGVLAVAAAVGSGSGDTDAEDVEPSAAVSTSDEPDTGTDQTAEEPEAEEPQDDIEEQPTEEPESDLGTREMPWNYGGETPVVFDVFGDADGSRWNVTIGELTDITETVLAENQFNDPPPEGVIFAGFSVEMTLVEADKEPLSAGFNFSFEVLGGATSAVYDPGTIETESFGCGVTPDAFDDFAEVFVGGTLTGTVCIPIPTEDVADPGTRVAMNFGEGRVHFG